MNHLLFYFVSLVDLCRMYLYVILIFGPIIAPTNVHFSRLLL
jgi:hypothetical protein